MAPDNDFDDLVRANIQEVLQAVAQEGCQPTRGPHQQQLTDEADRQPAPAPESQAALEVQHSSEATIRVLKARITFLEQQLSTAVMFNQEKDTEVAELQKQIKLYSQKEAASSKNVKALEAQVERNKKAAEAARGALAAREHQLKEFSKEAAKAGKDRHLVQQESRTRDVRLQRALEEVERYKQLLQDVKMQGQEVKDVAKSEHSKALIEVKHLERQRGELMNVLRKQAKLIDVLRRQRAHLEAARLLAYTEDEFMRTLEAGA